MKAKPRAKLKAGLKARPKGQPGESKLASRLKAGLLALVLLGLLAQSIGFARTKSRQHLRILPQAPLAAQGTDPGKVSAVVALVAGPEGSLFTLSNNPQGYFVQRFDSHFVFQAAKLFDPKKKPFFKELAAMAALPEGGLLLAERNGRVLRLSPDFKPQAEFQLNLSEVKAMGLSPDGKLLVLEPLQLKVLAFSLQGAPLSEFGAGKLVAPKALAVTSAGRTAVLDQDGGTYFIRVFDSAGKFERSLRVDNVTPSPPDTMAAGAKELVVINDAAGARGALFYDVAQGLFYGETLGAAGSEEPIVSPGFVGADPRTGDFYIHFGPGLMKCRVPEN